MPTPNNDGQDQGELLDVLPTPDHMGPQTDEARLPFLLAANTDGRFPTITRRDAHARGAWHRSVGLWLYTADGDVVLQKRSHLKDTNPGKWQMSVAGHVASGQSVLDAVLSEAHEELGIKLKESDVEFVIVSAKSESGHTERFGKYVDSEYKCMFISKIERQDFKVNDMEVSAYEYRNMHDAFNRFRMKDTNYCPMTEQYADIADTAIMNALKR